MWWTRQVATIVVALAAWIDTSCNLGTSTLETYYSNFSARQLYAQKWLKYRKSQYWRPGTSLATNMNSSETNDPSVRYGWLMDELRIPQCSSVDAGRSRRYRGLHADTGPTPQQRAGPHRGDIGPPPGPHRISGLLRNLLDSFEEKNELEILIP